MILNQYGDPIPEANDTQPRSGRMIAPDLSDRGYEDVARRITPAKVDRILAAADGGDASDQAELAELILEKNHTIAESFDIRCKAVLGLKWHVDPGDESPAAQDAAEAFEKALKDAGARQGCDTFKALLSDMLKSLIVGYSLNEIYWGPGGSLIGFGSINSRDIDFLNSFTPRIRLSNAGGSIEPEANKFVYAHCRMHGSDPVRGGLIRPLAWLHCFIQCNIKDLLSFIERYGMPFILAKVSEDSFNNERNELLRMISSFGSSGGGLVTQGTEIVPVQAPNTTGDVYFKMLEFFDNAVHRLLQGQTASSGDGGGLSKDNAQDKVRQDILESDVEYLADIINAQLAAPWCRFNFGAAPVPKLTFDVAPPEDKEKNANTLKTLYEAGFEADEEEVSERFGYKLRRRVPDNPAMPGMAETTQEDADAAHTLNLKQKYDAMGVAIRAGLLTSDPEIEEQTRRELNLPPMSEAVRKAWEATGGIRQPITLKTNEAAAVDEALNVDDKAAQSQTARQPVMQMSETTQKKTLDGTLETWIAPLERKLAELAEETDPGAFGRRLAELIDGDNAFGDSSKFEAELEGVIYSGIVAGAVATDRKLKIKDKR